MSDNAKILAAIYECSIDPSTSDHLLNCLKESFDAAHAAIFAHSIHGTRMQFGTFQQNDIDHYNNHVCAHDPWLAHIAPAPESATLSAADEDAINAKCDPESLEVFHTHFLHRHAIHDTLMFKMFSEDASFLSLALYKNTSHPLFSLQDVSRLLAYREHFHRGGVIFQRINANRNRYEAVSWAMDRLPFPAWIIDRELCILWRNDRAQQLADISKDSDIVEIITDRLAGHGSLSGLATGARNCIDANVPVSMVLYTKNGEHCPIHMTPLTGDLSARMMIPQALTIPREICLVMARPELPQAPALKEALASAYGFTDREADVAIALGAGLKPDEAAPLIDLKVETVRWYAKKIYQKTNMNTQSKLVELVSRFSSLVN